MSILPQQFSFCTILVTCEDLGFPFRHIFIKIEKKIWRLKK